jgi:hypothetical protein
MLTGTVLFCIIMLTFFNQGRCFVMQQMLMMNTSKISPKRLLAVLQNVTIHRNPEKLDIFRQIESTVERQSHHSWMKSTKFKLMITSFGAICIILELFETLLEKLPIFSHFAKKFLHVRLGVLLLCVSQVVHLVEELLENLLEREEAMIENELEEELKTLLKQKFSSEIEAAKAYDKVAMILFGHHVQLNFHYPRTDPDENGEIPRKFSKYRGIRYNNRLNTWHVDGAYLHGTTHGG